MGKIPKKNEDYKNLNYYKYYDLRTLLFNGNIHRKELIDNLFIRTNNDEDAQILKNYLSCVDEYTKLIADIICNKDEKYKVQLVMRFEPELFEIIYKNDIKKLINAIANDCEYDDFFEYINCMKKLSDLAIFANDSETIKLIKNGIKKLSKKWTAAKNEHFKDFIKEHKNGIEELLGSDMEENDNKIEKSMVKEYIDMVDKNLKK